jgi:hypothetical protein
MITKGHNKKRSVGIVYEMLVRQISTSLVEGDQDQADAALQVLKRHFKQGTELYKEFRLVNSLMKVSVSNQGVATSILSEAKVASRQHNEKQLDREKSLLIRDINHRLNVDGGFWDQPVAEYKMYATIQTLVNDWRYPGQAPLERLAEYEDRLVRWLTEERTDPKVKEELAGTTGENRLVFKLMMKRLNEKYGFSLTSDQKSVLREYVFTTSTGRDVDQLKGTLQQVKENVTLSIDRYLVTGTLNDYMSGKVKEARAALDAETLSEVNDVVVTRFMLYMKLDAELRTEE